MNDGYKYAPSLGRRPQNPLAMGVSLPYLGEMGKFGRWLDADAHRAAEQGDSARFVADVDALLGMVGQCLQQKFIISTLNGLHWADVAAGAILEECEHPDLLDNGQLRALAHGLGGLGGGRIRIDASNERIAIDDIVQRFFSDDGHGDGRFVASPEMDAFCEDYGIAKPKAYVFLQAIQPLKSAIIPNRAAINERADRFAAAAALDDSLPLWRHDERSSDKEWNALMGSGVYTVFPAIRVLYEGFGDSPIAFACGARDIVEAKRDAALTVLALVAFQREHGAWPARLDELVPSFLPRVPVDPFDGHPMQYRGPTKEGGRPLLYSVGVDGTDQGGISPTTLEGWYGVHNLHWIAKFRHPQPMAAAERQQMDAVRGDWVLWPVPAKVAEGDGVKGGGAR
jgi:hypothetical protein